MEKLTRQRSKGFKGAASGDTDLPTGERRSAVDHGHHQDHLHDGKQEKKLEEEGNVMKEKKHEYFVGYGA